MEIKFKAIDIYFYPFGDNKPTIKGTALVNGNVFSMENMTLPPELLSHLYALVEKEAQARIAQPYV
jgi:hypothetical protein